MKNYCVLFLCDGYVYYIDMYEPNCRYIEKVRMNLKILKEQ